MAVKEMYALFFDYGIPNLCRIESNIKKLYKHLLYQNQKINQLHTISHTQQGRQIEPSVKIHCSRLSTEFWRQCVLSSRIQCRDLRQHQSEEIKI